MTRLLLIRHAPTAETGTRLSGRLPDIPLTERGMVAAKETASRLADLSLAAIYTSPIERAVRTAEALCEGRDLDPVIEEGLIEVDMGDWSGRTLNSLTRLKAWGVVQFNPSRFRFPGGEGIAAMQHRSVAACERIVARHRSNDAVAAVGHADVIKAVLCHYLGQPLDLFQRIVISPTSVSVIDFPTQGIPVVSSVNSNGGEGSWR